MRRSTGHGEHENLQGCSIGGDIDVQFLPLSNSHKPALEENYCTNLRTSKPQYCTAAQADMEILQANDSHNAVPVSVHLLGNIPSSLTRQNAELSAASDHRLPSYNNSTQRPLSFASAFTGFHHSGCQNLQLLPDNKQQHQWRSNLRACSAASNPHAELLLLPGVSEAGAEAYPSSVSLPGSSNLDLLNASSLHDKQDPAMAVPLGLMGESRRLPPPASQWWSLDKLDMAVGLGLHDNSSQRCTQLAITDADHHAFMRSAAQSSISLLLQPPFQRAHSTVLSLDAARYSARPAPGTSGVLRSSKYLKPAQHLLNECCNLCREPCERTRRSSDTAKSSSISTSFGNMQWTGDRGGDGSGTGADLEDDDEQASRSSLLGWAAQKSSHSHILLHKNKTDKEGKGKTCTGTNPQSPAKQLPADERCHLQMTKASLIAMVEELDRRYQQYKDQMQLIVTSYESAAGMGAATPYTTLARKAMSRQFRGLRDAIGDHIGAVCRVLGEEVSSVPILSRGETPRLRIVDQRLRHQRSLQQIGMLPHHQQAWRPQRGLPERSVSVLRAWLFEHFLYPYPKDSEKAMLARLTGLSRSQVSNWFINARVRLWKPMIEEMYMEESRALNEQQEQETEGVIKSAGQHGTEKGGDGDDDVAGGGTTSMRGMRWIIQEEEKQQNPALEQQVHLLLGGWHPAHYTANGDTEAHSDLHSLIQFHSSARNAADAPDKLSSSSDCQSHPFSWMKPPTPAVPSSAYVGDIGNILTPAGSDLYNSHGLHQISSDSQASALIQQTPFFSSSTSSLYKNGVSLTLGLQQPPLHSPFNPKSISASNAFHGRPSEALFF